MKLSRRNLIILGAAGSLMLTSWQTYELVTVYSPDEAFNKNYKAIWESLVGCFLAHSLVPFGETKQQEIQVEIVAKIQDYFALLPDVTKSEIIQFFRFLDWLPTRIILTGQSNEIYKLSSSQIEKILDSWRQSELVILRSAFNGLKNIVLGVWYADHRSWSEVGYPGPPF